MENGEERPGGKEGKFEWEEVENLKLKGESMKMSRGHFFFFFFFLPFHFLKPLKFVWGQPKWKFFTKKKHILHRGKNREK